MKNNWTQVLVFSLLSVILGFILGRVTGNGHGEHGLEKQVIMKHLGEGEEDLVWNSEEGGENVFILKGEKDEAVQMIIEKIEASDFQGDTVIEKGDTKIHIIKKDGNMQVEVEAGAHSGKGNKEMRGDKEVRIRVEKEDPS